MSAGWDTNASLHYLFFRSLADAVARLRTVKDQPGQILSMDAEKRSALVTAAAYILAVQDELPITIPSGVLSLAKQVLDIERRNAGELFAMSVAGGKWNFPATCLRCGRAAPWKMVLSVPDVCPPEMAWRYRRPENHVPLCKNCTSLMQWREHKGLRAWVAELLWGNRFIAFLRWHAALKKGLLPQWNRLEYPLWPPEFADGNVWELGGGAYDTAVPRPPSELKIAVARNVIRDYFPTGRGARRRKESGWILKMPVTDRLG